MKIVKSRVERFALPCFYCTADSTELKFFLIALIGFTTLSTICFAIWAYSKGYFKNLEKNKWDILQLENNSEDIYGQTRDK